MRANSPACWATFFGRRPPPSPGALPARVAVFDGGAPDGASEVSSAASSSGSVTSSLTETFSNLFATVLFGFQMAGVPGFEPGLSVLETDVLTVDTIPLHQVPVSGCQVSISVEA